MGADVGGKLVVIGSKLNQRPLQSCSAAELKVKGETILWQRNSGLPVCGLSEGGKTKFIQETFEANFDSGDKTLLLICEEGEEYNEKKFAFPGVTVKVLEGQGRKTEPAEVCSAGKGNRRRPCGREYNGMWLLPDLAEALPGWIVYQCHRHRRRHHLTTTPVTTAHAQPAADKIARSELIVSAR